MQTNTKLPLLNPTSLSTMSSSHQGQKWCGNCGTYTWNGHTSCPGKAIRPKQPAFYTIYERSGSSTPKASEWNNRGGSSSAGQGGQGGQGGSGSSAGR